MLLIENIENAILYQIFLITSIIKAVPFFHCVMKSLNKINRKRGAEPISHQPGGRSSAKT
jgi:hypothetical protein